MKHNTTRWAKRIAIIAVIVVVAFAIPLVSIQARSSVPVLAFYYTHYNMGNWSYDWMPDIPAPKYSSGDGDAINRHIEQANTAGINGFICNWRGPEDQSDGRCRSLQKRIERSDYDMKIAFMPDLSRDSGPEMHDRDELEKALRTLNDEVMNRESYWRFQGKPVLIFMNPNYFGDPEDWRRFRNQIDLDRHQYWMVGTDIPALQDDVFNYMSAFDSVFLYDMSAYPNPATAMGTHANRVNQYNYTHAAQMPYIATVMPGFDDRRVNPQGTFHDRANGLYFQTAWQAITQHSPQAVFLESFNNFYNGTYIEPSEIYGYAYLGLTQELIGNFQANRPATPYEGLYFAETGHHLKGVFRSYWERHNGLERFGYPITEEFVRKSDNKVVQYFERARFELRVENDQAMVDLGLLGKEYAELYEVSFTKPAPFASTPMQRYFPETGYGIAGVFKQYWEMHGGIGVFGLPISEEIVVKFADGQERRVQYFERVRMELHGQTVLLGRLGVDLAPCSLLPAWDEDAPPETPLTDVDMSPCADVFYDSPKEAREEQETVDLPVSNPASSTDLGAGLNQQAHGRAYPLVVAPHTIQGFEAWDYAPWEEVSLWYNLPDGSTRGLPYTATADGNGYVLIGFQTERTDPEGQWSLVGKGLTSGRVVVAPFELKWQ